MQHDNEKHPDSKAESTPIVDDVLPEAPLPVEAKEPVAPTTEEQPTATEVPPGEVTDDVPDQVGVLPMDIEYDDDYVETTVESTVTAPDPLISERKPIGVSKREPLKILFGDPNGTASAINRHLHDAAAFESPEATNDWRDSVMEGYKNYYVRNMTYEATATRAGGEWDSGITVGDKRYRAANQNLPVASGELLTGVKALTRVMRSMGMGAIIQVPLWNSGIWVGIKAPADGELLELERMIANEKIALGRMTKGLIFSNTSVYITGHLVTFILGQIHSTTAPSDDINELKKLIRVSDIPSMVWGLICAIYPDGYPFDQPCTADLSKCHHTTSALLNLTKLQWVNRAALSNEQKAHMTRRTTKSTAEQITKYQAGFSEDPLVAKVSVTDTLSLELAVPSIQQHEDSGYAWVEGIIKSTEDAFGSTLRGKERDDYTMDMAKTMAIRQYSHWIRRIEITDENGAISGIEDLSTLEASTIQLSSSEELKSKIIKAIATYIDATTVCLIGILNFACPKCGELQMKGNGAETRVIPLDIVSIFLTLQRHKIEQALSDAQIL